MIASRRCPPIWGSGPDAGLEGDDDDANLRRGRSDDACHAEKVSGFADSLTCRPIVVSDVVESEPNVIESAMGSEVEDRKTGDFHVMQLPPAA